MTSGDLLIVGSPFRDGGPTQKIIELLGALGSGELAGVKAAAFVSRPMPFYVKGSEGPLRSGETQKAVTWAKTIMATLAQRASEAANQKGTQP